MAIRRSGFYGFVAAGAGLHKTRAIVVTGNPAWVENKRVSEFASMSDEELEAYVNGDRGLEH